MSTPTITATAATRAGVNVTTGGQAATGGGDIWANSGREYLIVKNGGGSPITVTLTYTATFDGVSPTSKTVSVPAADTVIIGPFPPSLYNDASGNAGVTYSAVTSVTIQLYQVPVAPPS